MGHTLLAPAAALIIWTLVMLVWLYATRIPAMLKLKIDPQEAARTGIKPKLPARVERVADNYNHLHEQPTLFYAACVIGYLAGLNVAGVTDPIAYFAAWTYVGLRVVHSLIQATANIIMVRFSIFIIASITLGVLVFEVARALIG